MIYFWSKYNNIRMDFSDFSEFIGPIIFGLIAWLSNYFGKKKKPSKNDPNIEKKPSSFSNPFEKIFDEANKLKEDVSDNNEEMILKEEIIKPIDQTNEIEREKVIQKVEEEESEINVPSYKRNKVKKSNKTVETKTSIRNKLKNKKGLKEAIILKEILDRKY